MASDKPEEYEDISEDELEAIYADAAPFATDEMMFAAIEQLNSLEEIERPNIVRKGEVSKRNPYHDSRGRFTSASSAISVAGGRSRTNSGKNKMSSAARRAASRVPDSETGYGRARVSLSGSGSKKKKGASGKVVRRERDGQGFSRTGGAPKRPKIKPKQSNQRSDYPTEEKIQGVKNWLASRNAPDFEVRSVMRAVEALKRHSADSMLKDYDRMVNRAIKNNSIDSQDEAQAAFTKKYKASVLAVEDAAQLISST